MKQVIDRNRLMYYVDQDGTVHLVPRYYATTLCEEKKRGWQRVPRQRVDCDRCADALRAELFREAEVVLGYPKWREGMDDAALRLAG